MLQQLLISVVVSGIASVAQEKEYKEYGNYDLRDSLKTKKSGDGRDEHSIDMKLVGQVLDDLAVHAKNYPPTFRSKEEKGRAERDAKMLAFMFETLTARDDVETEMLLNAGFLNSIAHNLDVKGASQKAAAYFERLLKREPDHPKGNYHYGVFLAGTATKQKESLPYLEKALKLGVEDARFSLGLAHLMLGDKTKSLEYLESYSQKNPDDEKAKRLIDAIKAGRIKVEKKSQ